MSEPSVNLFIRVPPDWKARLQACADERGVSMTDIIVGAVAAHIDRLERRAARR